MSNFIKHWLVSIGFNRTLAVCEINKVQYVKFDDIKELLQTDAQQRYGKIADKLDTSAIKGNGVAVISLVDYNAALRQLRQ